MISFWKNILQKKVQVRLCLNYSLINIQIRVAKSHGPLWTVSPIVCRFPRCFQCSQAAKLVRGGTGSGVRVGSH